MRILGWVTLNTDNNGTPSMSRVRPPTTVINIGSGNTVVDVTTNGQNLGQLGSDLTVNGGIGLDSLVVNDSADPLAQSTTRLGTTVTARTYSYGVTSTDISRTATSSRHRSAPRNARPDVDKHSQH